MLPSVQSSGGVGEPTLLVVQSGSPTAQHYAATVAGIFLKIEPTANPDMVQAATEFQTAIVDALAPHFALVMLDEQTMLANDEAHCDSLIIADDASQAVRDVQAASVNTQWNSHLRSDEWKTFASVNIGQWMHTARKIERCWFADRTGNPSAARYKASFNKGI